MSEPKRARILSGSLPVVLNHALLRPPIARAQCATLSAEASSKQPQTFGLTSTRCPTQVNEVLTAMRTTFGPMPEPLEQEKESENCTTLITNLIALGLDEAAAEGASDSESSEDDKATEVVKR